MACARWPAIMQAAPWSRSRVGPRTSSYLESRVHTSALSHWTLTHLRATGDALPILATYTVVIFSTV